jgi:hypothetical protein
MAGYRRLRRVPSLRSIVARRKKRSRYTDYVTQPVKSPKAVSGEKIADKI